MRALSIRQPWLEAVLGVATVAACHRRFYVCNRTGVWSGVCTPWSAWGQCHWVLEDVRALAEPVPCRGRLGLWPLPADVEAAVRAQLPAGSLR